MYWLCKKHTHIDTSSQNNLTILQMNLSSLPQYIYIALKTAMS